MSRRDRVQATPPRVPRPPSTLNNQKFCSAVTTTRPKSSGGPKRQSSAGGDKKQSHGAAPQLLVLESSSSLDSHNQSDLQGYFCRSILTSAYFLLSLKIFPMSNRFEEKWLLTAKPSGHFIYSSLYLICNLLSQPCLYSMMKEATIYIYHRIIGHRIIS